MASQKVRPSAHRHRGRLSRLQQRIAEHVDALVGKLGTKERTKVYRSLDEVPEDACRHIEERHRHDSGGQARESKIECVGNKEEVITYDKNVAPKQEALLRGHNFREYPTIQELSEGKDNENNNTFQTNAKGKSQKERVLNHINKLAEKQLWLEHRVDQ